MSNRSWLKKLSPGELHFMRDLATVVDRIALNREQGTTASAEIRQEIERRRKNEIISTMTHALRKARRGE